MEEVKIRVEGLVGRIILNRPKVLNSLTANMLSTIERALDGWQNDDNIAAVIISAKGEKAFCAGGDITNIYTEALKQNFEYGKLFWINEYRLNLKISEYPKPFVALMQGFTMGGGVGISCHGSHRVVGENSVIAMPECSIGLVPDVGGSHLLARLGSHLGTFLGTTAFRMNAGNAVYCRFADYYIPRSKWKCLIRDISESGNVDSVLRNYMEKPPSSTIKLMRPLISEVYDTSNFNQIEVRMIKHSIFSDALKHLQRNSPLSVAVTFEMLKLSQVSQSVESALEVEYRYTSRAQEKTDFLEGIRAMVIDKDRKPKWRHSSLRDVQPDEVNELLSPVGNSE